MRWPRKALCAGIVWCMPLALHAASASSDFAPIQKSLGIPTSLAIVTDASMPKGAASDYPEFILIQDIHRHPEAQGNIRATILYSLKHWNHSEVFLEGAWAQGKTQDYSFSGLENEQLYRDNVAAYQAVAEVQEAALEELETATLFGNVFDDARGPSWGTIKRLIQLRLKPSEYAEYVKTPFHSQTPSALATAVSSAEHFYELANARSHVFLDKAKSPYDGPRVLVIGGFHTVAMAEELRRQGYSYAVLSPRVTQGGYEGLYAQGMHETISALKLH